MFESGFCGNYFGWPWVNLPAREEKFHFFSFDFSRESQFETLPASAFWPLYDNQVSGKSEGKNGNRDTTITSRANRLNWNLVDSVLSSLATRKFMRKTTFCMPNEVIRQLSIVVLEGLTVPLWWRLMTRAKTSGLRVWSTKKLLCALHWPLQKF